MTFEIRSIKNISETGISPPAIDFCCCSCLRFLRIWIYFQDFNSMLLVQFFFRTNENIKMRINCHLVDSLTQINMFPIIRSKNHQSLLMASKNCSNYIFLLFIYILKYSKSPYANFAYGNSCRTKPVVWSRISIATKHMEYENGILNV